MDRDTRLGEKKIITFFSNVHVVLKSAILINHILSNFTLTVTCENNVISSLIKLDLLIFFVRVNKK